MRRVAYEKTDRKDRRRRHHRPPEELTPEERDNYTKMLTHQIAQMERAHDVADEVLAMLSDPEFLERSATTKAALDEATKELNLALTRAEEALVQRATGRCAAVELELVAQRGAREFKITDHWALLFWHVSGVWGLHTINNKGKIQRLLHAPRNVRMAACRALEDLWNQLQYEEEEAPA